MADKAHEFMENMIEQRLTDIAAELKNISIILEGFKAQAEAEQKLSSRLMLRIQHMQAAMSGPRLVSGRWPLRDGNTYGNVAPQPETVQRVGPPIERIEEPGSGDDQAGDLRATDER